MPRKHGTSKPTGNNKATTSVTQLWQDAYEQYTSDHNDQVFAQTLRHILEVYGQSRAVTHVIARIHEELARLEAPSSPQIIITNVSDGAPSTTYGTEAGSSSTSSNEDANESTQLVLLGLALQAGVDPRNLGLTDATDDEDEDWEEVEAQAGEVMNTSGHNLITSVITELAFNATLSMTNAPAIPTGALPDETWQIVEGVIVGGALLDMTLQLENVANIESSSI